MRAKRFFMKWKFGFDGEDFTDRVTNVTQIKVYKKIVLSSNKNTLEWFHTTESRTEICEALNISEVSFKRALKDLVRIDLLIKPARGHFRLNERFVTYGKQGNE